MQVNYEDAAVLREGLARVFKLVPKPIQAEIIDILTRYGKSVHKYCVCPHKVFHPYKEIHICIDCGRQWAKLQENAKNLEFKLIEQKPLNN